MPPLLPLLRPFMRTTLLVTASTIFLNDNLYEVTSIYGTSMVPTLSPDYHTAGKRDYILWRKRHPTHNLARGDIVHFSSPSHPDGLAVKRVVGLEGDTVELDQRRRPMGSGNAGAEIAWRAWGENGGEVTVPQGHVWVEGDNWRGSRDSNYYGPISRSLILGKAVCVVAPWRRIGTRPWEGWEGDTNVVEGKGRAWTGDGVPVEVVEIVKDGLSR